MKCLKYVVWLLPILILATANFAAFATGDHCIVVYYTRGTRGGSYVDQLENALKSSGVTNVVKYDCSANDKAARDQANLREFFDVPAEFLGSVTIFVDGKYIFEGFFPIDVIVGFVNSDPRVERLIAAEGRSSDKYLLRRDDQTYEFSSSQGIAGSLAQVDAQNQLLTVTQYLTLIIIVAATTIIVLKKRKH